METPITEPTKNFSVGESNIANAGKGLFANQPIAAGTLLFIAFALRGDNGKASDSVDTAAQLLQNDAKPVFEAKYVQLFPNDFINHSKEPNCQTVLVGDVFFVMSLKNIQQGEELTKDYSATMQLIENAGYHLADDFLDF
jgi:hypothetical protein